MAELELTAPGWPAGPAGPDCDPDWLGTAIDLAQHNIEAGGRPFGAVVVLDGEPVATGVNEVLARNDPTAHAELLAIREACAALKDISLAGAVLYSSCEPCPMCLAAAMWAGLAAVIYGADTGAAAEAGFEDEKLYELFAQPRDTWPMPIRQQVRASAEDPLREWSRRQNG